MWNNEISKKIGMNCDNTIIVDDVKEVCIMNIDNHYHIKHCDYYDHTDNELESVYLFLEKKIWNLDKNSPVWGLFYHSINILFRW